ncbi:MAG: HEAT repeat domain-containing protein, partial [Candidatus Riflebacteria bacterium]|nr:HEAT repeat domain-containing protein [Candidatus Riflebacteria bacterium]
DILYPVISRLHDIAQGRRPGPLERTVSALGSLRHPGSLPILEQLARGPIPINGAASALARYNEPHAEAVVLEIAGNRDCQNRAAALLELGQVRSVDPLSTLEAAIKDPAAEVRKAAATALGGHPKDRSVELLVGRLSDGEESVVLAALGALARLRNAAALGPIIQRVRAQTTPRVRASSAIALARLESRESQEVLMKLLADKDDRVRANAVEALGHYSLSYDWAMRIFPPLLKDEHHRVRGNAALAVFRFNQQMALDTIKRMFDSSNKNMRAAAAYCASQVQNKETANWLATLVLTELDTDVISSALRALERFNRKEVLDTFLKVTKHNKAEVRTLAVAIVGNIGTPAHVGFLITMFKTEKEPTARSAIVSALAKLAGVEGLNFLPQYLSDPDERVVANAIDGLNRSGNLEVISYLKPLLKHANNRIRANTVLALWNLGDTKALAELQKMLDSPDPAFTDSAIYVMGAIGDSLRLVDLESHPMLPIALRDYYKRVVERGEGLRVAPIGPTGSAKTGEPELVTERLASPAPPAPAPVGPEPTASAEFLDVIETADMTPALGTVTQRVNEEEELERILMQQGQESESLRKHLQMFTTLYSKNPFAQYLTLQTATDGDEPLGDKLMAPFERGESDFLPPLFLLARTFRKRGEVERSLATYLRIFRKELELLEQMVDFGLQELGNNNSTPASTVMKTISAIIGLKPDLHALLGDFYLSEKAYDPAYRHFYMAHVAEPADVSVALKLAFLCGKTKRKGLGREICHHIVKREGPESENSKKARKILERLELEGRQRD